MLRHLAKLRILYVHTILILSEFPEQLQCMRNCMNIYSTAY